jgi:hypothetical protein
VAQITATPGEYEPVSITYISAKPFKEVKVVTSDLISPNAIIEESSIDVRVVKRWYQSGNAWQSIRQDKSNRVLIPELLLKNEALVKVDYEKQVNYILLHSLEKNDYKNISSDNVQLGGVKTSIADFPISDSLELQPIDFTANENKQLWLTVLVPKQIAAGEYSGTVKLISSSGSTLSEVSIGVTVLPFKLSQSVLEYSLYYRGKLDGVGSISSEEKNKYQMLAEYNDMLAHGVTNPTVYQPPNIQKLTQVLDIRKDAGVSANNLYYLGITSGNFNDSSDLEKRYEQITGIRDLAQGYDLGQIYLYGIDEADISQIPGQYPVWDKFADLGARVFVAAWRTDREQYFENRVDMLVNGATPNASDNQNYRKKGTKVYLYNRPQVGVENPAVYRINYGINAWRYNFDGVMNYAYQHSMGDIWNDFDHPEFRDHVFAYPTVDGVVPTIAWEGFREAIDDVRYLSTLLEFASQSGSVDAHNFLEKFRADMGIEPDEARQMIIDQILKICKCTTENGSSPPKTPQLGDIKFTDEFD